ncbi:MAG: flagellar basal body L-ring protein FlgH [Rhodothermales bacterium]|nr:flagellar basal body L-ring protein FlgH [Rhodothermales bacterium]MBO6780483.1 flagellar basal body L-ring protein FlgH [Rhodothermales bacterium]
MSRFSLIAVLLLSAAPLSAQSLYSDFRARNAGDIITIVLVEKTSAQRASKWQNAASNGVDASSGVAGASNISGRFGMDARFSKDAQSRNSSVQRDLLTGTMTATIVERDQSGNLMLEGSRSLNVNGETHVMKVTGFVRPVDIRTNNSVLSYNIANAQIEYKRQGGLTRGLFKPGKIARFGAIALLGAAVALGASQ